MPAIEPEPVPAVEPEPARIETTAEIAPLPTPIAAETAPEIAPEITPEPAPPPKPEAPPVTTPEPIPEASAPQKNPAPHFSVMPKGTTFMPPSIRSLNGGMPPPKPKLFYFSYAGVALAVFIVGVILTCILLFAWHGMSSTPNPFTPRNSISPPAQTSVETPAAPTGPTTVSEFSDRGTKRQSEGDLDGAIQDFTQAIALDPKAVDVYYQRGLALQAKGDMNGAAADYTQVIALDPKRAIAFSNRGFIKQRQLDFDGALGRLRAGPRDQSQIFRRLQ